MYSIKLQDVTLLSLQTQQGGLDVGVRVGENLGDRSAVALNSPYNLQPHHVGIEVHGFVQVRDDESSVVHSCNHDPPLLLMTRCARVEPNGEARPRTRTPSRI